MEQEYTEAEMKVWLEAVATSTAFHTKIIDPVIKVLETTKGRKEYINLGTEFLDANAGMLAKEFPTKRVSYPRLYVDRCVSLFGFTNASLKEDFQEVLKDVSKSDFKTITSTPTNILHAIALVYSDMVQHRELRDSAKQQLGLTTYGLVFNHSFPNAEPAVPVMTYTYMHLDNSWGLVKSENVINWIGETTETCFAFWRSRMSLNMDIKVMVDFLNRIRTSFQQNMRTLANKYYDNIDKGNEIGTDLKGDEDYVETSNTTTYRNNLVRLITTGDKDYKTKSQMYKATAEQKNVKVDDLYELAQRVDTQDISNIIDLIFYVFIVKENHKIDEINSTVYISRITKMPTAIDRAIPGKPVIDPFIKKYKCNDLLAKAYICLLATFIILKMNRIRH
jgi:hypothetical protein